MCKTLVLKKNNKSKHEAQKKSRTFSTCGNIEWPLISLTQFLTKACHVAFGSMVFRIQKNDIFITCGFAVHFTKGAQLLTLLKF